MAVRHEQASGPMVTRDRQVRHWDTVPLFEALRSHRSRRFGLGMRMDGPLSFESRRDPVPLTEQSRPSWRSPRAGSPGMP
jgi:hypothetical protein